MYVFIGRISRTMNNIMLVIVLGNFQMRRFTCLHIHGVNGKVGNVFCVVGLILCFAFDCFYNYIDYITMLIILLLIRYLDTLACSIVTTDTYCNEVH